MVNKKVWGDKYFVQLDNDPKLTFTNQSIIKLAEFVRVMYPNSTITSSGKCRKENKCSVK